MFRDNLKVFLIYLVVILLFILLKNGQIFDASSFFRFAFGSPQMTNKLLLPPDNLEEANQKLLAEIQSLKVLEIENNELRDLLAYKEKTNYELIVADILGRDPNNENIILLNVGENKGIEVGQAAVISDGVIIGKIIEVTTDASKLRLLTDNFSKIAVKIGDNYQVSGLLTGSLGLGMNLTYIPQEQEIKKGDLVVTSAVNTIIPEGLVVGTIEEVKFSKEEIFKQASVLPLVDYQTLSLISIIKKQ